LKFQLLQSRGQDRYRQRYEAAQSISRPDSLLPTLGENPRQFVDMNANGKSDSGDVKIEIEATSLSGYTRVRQRIVREEPFAPSGLQINVLRIRWCSDHHCNENEIAPAVKVGSRLVLATHLQHFKVADFNGDGLLDYAFETVDMDSHATSLNVYLQQQTEALPTASTHGGCAASPRARP
ncbi:MAG: hypothetical protein HY465_01240, partial [Deltaproteobacteria bacterium]|nr:hypothetical protein [Deltaproteobacteria bacterium]